MIKCFGIHEQWILYETYKVWGFPTRNNDSTIFLLKCDADWGDDFLFLAKLLNIYQIIIIFSILSQIINFKQLIFKLCKYLS